MTAYYNDHDHHAAHWLRCLIREGLIPDGDVDERPIEEVRPGELAAYAGVHFFAGIGGWPYALRLAGWPDDRPVWTGSCPCQPFSTAGKRRGTDDERHVWPEFERLIADGAPERLFGEQVASPAGRDWLAGVRGDLEALGYAVGAADLCAAGVGAPHIRQRLFWVAHAQGERSRPEGAAQRESGGRQQPSGRADARVVGGDHGRLGDAGVVGLEGGADGATRQAGAQLAGAGAALLGLGDGDGPGPQPGQQAVAPAGHGPAALADGRGADCWSDFIVVACNDGKLRRAPVEPAFFPLADGVPGRVAQLRGLGNAIVPWLAKEFIEASCEAIELTLNPA